MPSLPVSQLARVSVTSYVVGGVVVLLKLESARCEPLVSSVFAVASRVEQALSLYAAKVCARFSASPVTLADAVATAPEHFPPDGVVYL